MLVNIKKRKERAMWKKATHVEAGDDEDDAPAKAGAGDPCECCRIII